MPTVQEILKQTGLTDEQISALDPKVVTGFTTVVTTATQTLEAAELAKRAQAQQYETEIAPALDGWANEKAAYATREAAYQAALKAAKEGGFQVPDILNAQPVTPPGNRNPNGQFVANANAVPGSPEMVNKFRDEIGGAFAFVADATHKYRQLFGSEMPDLPTAIIREAESQRMSPAAWAAKKYDFAGKEKAIAEQKQKERDDKIRQEAVAETTKKFTEQGGSNPNVRQAVASRFTELDRAVKANQRPDPLSHKTREQRHQATRENYMKEAVAAESVQ